MAILGPSGSGKSTLMNVLGCLDSPSSGDYWLNGKEVSALPNKALASIRNQQIGFVFQSFNLLDYASALDNVALPLVYAGIGNRQAKQRAGALLERVGLGNRLRHKPNQLSGGQKQRVAIARALINEPNIILADEPTGALDTQSGIEIEALFKELNGEGCTLIVVTHDVELAHRANRIVTIRDGQIESDVQN